MITKSQLVEKLLSKGVEYPLPASPDIKAYLNAGVLPKSDLEHGAYYYGLCRQAHIAVWDKNKGIFHYIRQKFTSFFIEDIKHLEDDDGYDLFLPFEKV